MANSIETFVQKLQAEGVQAGREEAQKLVDEARAEAEGIVAQAGEQAERITGEAREKAAESLRQGQDELELAARDVLLKLREAVMRALQAVLARGSGEALADKEFLAKLIHDVVVQYAQKDAAGAADVEVQVSDEALQSLTDWAAKEMAQEKAGSKPQVNFKGRLASAGFEYTTAGGKIEVTPESIASVLSEMVSPRLKELLDKAQAGEE